MSQPAAEKTVCVGHSRCIFKRNSKTMLKPQPGSRGEETNLQFNPQLETFCARELNLFGRRKPEFHNMQISDSRHLETGFKNTKKKVNLAEDAPSGDPSTQGQHINLVQVNVGINEGSDSYGIRLYCDFGSLREHELRRASEFVRHHPEVGTQARETFPSWTRSSLAHDQAIKLSKSKQCEFFSDSVS